MQTPRIPAKFTHLVKFSLLLCPKLCCILSESSEEWQYASIGHIYCTSEFATVLALQGLDSVHHIAAALHSCDTIVQTDL